MNNYVLDDGTHIASCTYEDLEGLYLIKLNDGTKILSVEKDLEITYLLYETFTEEEALAIRRGRIIQKLKEHIKTNNSYNWDLLDFCDVEKVLDKLYADTDPKLYYYKKMLEVYATVNAYKKRCANACSDKEECFAIEKYFTCDHYQCLHTTIFVEYCIECGNDTQRY